MDKLPLTTSVLTSDPFIWIKDNALSSEFCQTLIDKFERSPNSRPGTTLEGVMPEVKSSQDLFITTDPDFLKEDAHLSNVLTDLFLEYKDKIPYSPWVRPIGDKGYNIQRTTPGQKYNWHDDHFVCLNPPHVRIVTFIFYLNTVNEGGETEFWNGFKVQPVQGRVLLFPAERTYGHRGCTPHRDTKYICTGWFHEDLPVS